MTSTADPIKRGGIKIVPKKRDLTKRSPPRWALDPLTKQVMTCPVSIRAPCNHCVDKSSFLAWTDKGNTVCPVCFTPMTQISAIPNKELAIQIENLKSANQPDEKDILFHPEMDTSSRTLNCNNDAVLDQLNASVQSLNWDSVFI